MEGTENVLGLGGTQKEHDSSGGKRKKPTYEDRLLGILESKANEEVDEDKSFLLSLLPAIKKMNDAEKLEAKMDFLAVIKRITIPPSQNYNQFPHPSYFGLNSYQGGTHFSQFGHSQSFMASDNTTGESSGSVTPVGAPSPDMPMQLHNL